MWWCSWVLTPSLLRGPRASRVELVWLYSGVTLFDPQCMILYFPDNLSLMREMHWIDFWKLEMRVIFCRCIHWPLVFFPSFARDSLQLLKIKIYSLLIHLGFAKHLWLNGFKTPFLSNCNFVLIFYILMCFFYGASWIFLVLFCTFWLYVVCGGGLDVLVCGASGIVFVLFGSFWYLLFVVGGLMC